MTVTCRKLCYEEVHKLHFSFIISVIIITIIIKKNGDMYTDECININRQKCPAKDSRN